MSESEPGSGATPDTSVPAVNQTFVVTPGGNVVRVAAATYVRERRNYQIETIPELKQLVTMIQERRAGGVGKKK